VPSGGLKIFRKVLSIGLVCTGLGACSALSKDGGLIWALVSYGLAFAVWPRVAAAEQAAAERAYSAAKMEWEEALRRWKREASRDAFAERLKALEQVRAELADLSNERRRWLAKLEAEQEMRQRQRYLDRFRIDRAKIRGIASGRVAMLASYGIETAADIDGAKIMRIPGFGEALTSELVQWRQGHARNFRFNPSEPVDRRDLDAIDRELEARRQNLLSRLRRGPDLLRRLSQEINAARPRLMPTLEKAWIALKIAEARRNAL
jgi:DNA-binding helix-hairpin-helix protein with protein kinase domain